MSKLRERLKNPFALVGQGFVLGAVLFFATHPGTSEASAGPAPVEAVR